MPLLPLFPLPLVLFPETVLPLHIFEPRYKEMVGECLQKKESFGIVRAEEKGMARIGCTAEIMEVAKRYDDGRLDIVTAGTRRFEVVEINNERAFLLGEVSYFDDLPLAPPPKKQRDRVLQLHREVMHLTDISADFPNPEHQLLSFHLAESMPMDLDLKQALLGMRAESDRLRALIKYYEALLPTLERAIKVRKRAGGNGKG